MNILIEKEQGIEKIEDIILKMFEYFNLHPYTAIGMLKGISQRIENNYIQGEEYIDD